MTQKMFVERNFYTREYIHEKLGGGIQSYLPTSNGRVVCACLSKSLNPRAPEVILVGLGKIVVKTAEILGHQTDPIPIFVKESSNSWRFEGEYVSEGFKTDTATIQKEIVNSGREHVAGVLYLKKVAN